MTVSALIATPLGNIVQTSSLIARALACHDRIQAFLIQEEIIDIREQPTASDTQVLNSKDKGQLSKHNKEGDASMTEKGAISNEESSKAEETLTQSATEDTPAITETSTISGKSTKLTENSVDAMSKKKQTKYSSATVEKLCTSPISGAKQVLHDAEAYFPAGQLTMVSGAVGSGKTTLLKSLLGEIPTIGGKILVDRTSIAYCSQTPWLRAQSVKKNIIGPNPMSHTWYTTVTKACCLSIDFEQWSNGDSMEAGSAGSSLSGGQKQRIVRFTSRLLKKYMLINYFDRR